MVSQQFACCLFLVGIYYLLCSCSFVKEAPFCSCAVGEDVLYAQIRHFDGRCALLFFGVPRIFQSTAFPSIQRYILDPNKECDIFAHSYNISSLTVIRNDEKEAAIIPAELYLLVKNDTEKLHIENMESFYAERNLSFFRQHHHRGWGESIGSTDNMVKAWHSIEGVWNIMENYKKKYHKSYSRVGIFRSDLFYTHNISIQNPNEKAVLPDFAWNQIKMRDMYNGAAVNDRGMYGNFEHAKIWATERFSFIPWYAWRHSSELTPIDSYNPGQGIHSESFMYELLKFFQVPYEEKALCFFRLRANRVVLSEDCIVPKLHQVAKQSGVSSAEFNKQMLSHLMCKGSDSKVPAKPCLK